MSPNIPDGATPAGRCTHVLRPRVDTLPRWADDFEVFAATPDGERRYVLAGEVFHSVDGSACDQPIAPEWQ